MPHHLRCLSVLAALAACGPPGYHPTAVRARTTPIDPSAEDYFAAVWPDDRRLTSDGYVDTAPFPNPGGGALFDTVRDKASHLVRGWGLSAPLYMPFTGALRESSLPSDPADTVRADSPVLLMALDPASALYGRPVPLQIKLFSAPTMFLPGHVLAVRPVPGLPLEPQTRYALVVTSALLDARGEPTGPEEPLFRALVDDEPGSGFADAKAFWAPLRALLDAKGIERESVAGAAIFTTQEVYEELAGLRDWMETIPVPAVRDLRYVADRASFLLFEGVYDAPWLLHGTAPYETQGGDFRYDDAGQPVPALVDAMRLAVCVPKGEVPTGGFPVVFYSHGTGGSFESASRDGTCESLGAEGIAAFGIDQVLHGPRAHGATSCLGRDVEECFLNVVNPVAGRNLLRHSALDHVLLRRVVEALRFGAPDPERRDIRFSLRSFGFFGHSQGGLTGSIYAAMDANLAGALLSGAGGHLTTTLLERVDGDPRAMAEGPLFLNIRGQESLEQMHPALALVQTLAEATDPLSWARYWLREPPADGARRSMFVTSGLEDPYTPAPTAAFLAVAGGVPQMIGGNVDYEGFRFAGLAPVEAPVQGNVAASGPWPAATAVLRQFPGQGHFPIFDDPTARAQLRTFFRTLTAGAGPPLVPAP